MKKKEKKKLESEFLRYRKRIKSIYSKPNFYPSGMKLKFVYTPLKLSFLLTLLKILLFSLHILISKKLETPFYYYNIVPSYTQYIAVNAMIFQNDQ